MTNLRRYSAVLFYDNLAKDYDTHIVHRVYERLIISLLRQKIPQGKKILDIGCGTAHNLRQLSPSYGIGIDISREMINRANCQNKDKNIRFKLGDAETITLQKDFDYIIAIETIAYWHDPDAALANVRKFCTPETKVIVLSPNPLWDAPLQLLEKLGLKTADIQRNLPTKKQLHALFARHGFSVEVRHKIFGLQYLVIGRIMQRLPATKNHD